MLPFGLSRFFRTLEAILITIYFLAGAVGNDSVFLFDLSYKFQYPTGIKTSNLTVISADGHLLTSQDPISLIFCPFSLPTTYMLHNIHEASSGPGTILIH